MSNDNASSTWQAHACFDFCKKNSDCLLGFDEDSRPECNSTNKNSALLCLLPSEDCENFVLQGEICFDSAEQYCYKTGYIIIGVLLGDFLQLIFEAGMLYALEITFKPTNLDRLQDPEKFKLEENSDSNPDKKKELECSLVLTKCYGELLYIIAYLFAITGLVIGFTYQMSVGKPTAVLTEFGIVYVLSQIKSIPVQVVIYWVVIRRFGKVENTNFIEWNDEILAEKGP